MPLHAIAKQPTASAGDWSSPGLAAPVDPDAPRFFTTPSGVRVQELAIGKGTNVTPTSRVLVDYVLRRANGASHSSTLVANTAPQATLSIARWRGFPSSPATSQWALLPCSWYARKLVIVVVVQLAPLHIFHMTSDGLNCISTGPQGDGRVLVGLEEGLQGMAEGGKRRVLVPPLLGYSPDLSQQPLPPGFAARRQVATHREEPLLFEVQVLRVT